MKQLKKGLLRQEEIEDSINDSVKKIIHDIKVNGDDALLKYNETFDGMKRKSLRVTKEEIEECYQKVDPTFIEMMKRTQQRIEEFAKKQKDCLLPLPLEDEDIATGHRLVPVDSVLCYIPGGRYPLFSTALMLITPAKIAGVPRICGTTPPGKDGLPAITIVAMDVAGADEIYLSGGAQTIGAFTYGTESIDPVNMIVGPGNAYVAEAKRQCYGKVGIDFIAGPSEVLILADDSADPVIVAADLLAQSEHDPMAKGILVTTSKDLGKKVLEEVAKQLKDLSTREVAEKSWQNYGEIYLVDSWEEGVELSNSIAPEHLEVMFHEEVDLSLLRNYGSLFIGPYSGEVFGDYTSGPNHTLPTVGASKYTGGLSVLNFIKVQTMQKITKKGLQHLIKDTEMMAEGEGLLAHKNAATFRNKK
ncbi:MAG: histidinol dehydrogenase [Tissierellia bacterium]|nr:histidinol dehydrogenase [Tissierellia bacterium]